MTYRKNARTEALLTWYWKYALWLVSARSVRHTYGTACCGEPFGWDECRRCGAIRQAFRFRISTPCCFNIRYSKRLLVGSR